MSWIWLNKEKYRKHLTTKTFQWSKRLLHYTVVKIKKEYDFEDEIKEVDFHFASDCSCYIYVNGQLLTDTDLKAPADFMFEETPNVVRFLAHKKISIEKPSKHLSIVAFVEMGTTNLYDCSSGKGGFYLEGKVTLANKEKIKIKTDGSWDIRLENSFYKEHCYDQSLQKDDFEKAQEYKRKIKLIPSDLALPIEEEIPFNNHYVLKAGTRKTKIIDFPTIYSAFYVIEVKCNGPVNLKIITYENDNITAIDKYSFIKDDKVRTFNLHSTGKLKLLMNNKSNSEADIKVHLLNSHYPLENIGYIKTNNDHLNNILDKCVNALRNSIHTIYLDSPKHCEPLASCSGDYYIESLLHYVLNGDLSLAKHCLLGHSIILKRSHGRLSNASYALIYIIWLYKIYLLSKDRKLLEDGEAAIDAVIEEFSSYQGENKLIENPLNFGFVDWLMVDEVSTFAPPKALGQSVMTMFFYQAIKLASKINDILGNKEKAREYHLKAEEVKAAINKYLFDKERGLYIEGLTTKQEKLAYRVGENIDKVYYRKHANTLAVLFHLQDEETSKEIIHKIFNELKDLEMQPYFMHFLFEAVNEAGLNKEYAPIILKEWLDHVKDSDKGLPEGFYKPVESYKFDFSHAWACTPYYSFIIASLGKSLEEITKEDLNHPIDLGYEYEMEFITPQGKMKMINKKGDD